MDEETRKARQLEALELIAGELERLWLSKEHELGAQVKEDGGDPYVRPNGK